MRTMGEGVNFCYFGAYVLTEWPPSQRSLPEMKKVKRKANERFY